MIYGVYSNDALVHWPPSKIFVDEIRVSNVTSRLLIGFLRYVRGPAVSVLSLA